MNFGDAIKYLLQLCSSAVLGLIALFVLVIVLSAIDVVWLSVTESLRKEEKPTILTVATTVLSHIVGGVIVFCLGGLCLLGIAKLVLLVW